MKRMGLIAASFILLIGVTGCSLFPTGENYSWGEKEAEVTVAEDGATGKLNEKLVVNATIEEPKNITWKQYNVAQVDYTDEQLETIADSLKQKKSIKNKTKMEDYFDCEYSDGSDFTYNTQYGGFGISYTTKQSDKIEYSYMIEEKSGGKLLSEDDIKEMFPKDKLDGLSLDTAISNVKDICKKMNINIGDTPYMCIVMDYENANKVIEKDSTKGADKNGNVSKWTKSDDVYYMIFQQSVDDIAISIDSKSANFYTIPQTAVTAIVGRQGIVSVKTHYLSDKKSSENVTVIDSQKALNILATDTMYAAIGDMVLTNLSLEYVVYKDLKTKEDYIKPMWVYTFERTTTTEKNGETYTRTSKQTNFIDAVTGQVLGG